MTREEFILQAALGYAPTCTSAREARVKAECLADEILGSRRFPEWPFAELYHRIGEAIYQAKLLSNKNDYGLIISATDTILKDLERICDLMKEIESDAEYYTDIFDKSIKEADETTEYFMSKEEKL